MRRLVRLLTTTILLAAIFLILPASAEKGIVNVQDFSKTVLSMAKIGFGANIDMASAMNAKMVEEDEETITIAWGDYYIKASKQGHSDVLSAWIKFEGYSMFDDVKHIDTYKDLGPFEAAKRRISNMFVALEYGPIDEIAKTEGKAKEMVEFALSSFDDMFDILEQEYENVAGNVDIPCYVGAAYNYYWRCFRPMYLPLITTHYEIMFVAEKK